MKHLWIKDAVYMLGLYIIGRLSRGNMGKLLKEWGDRTVYLEKERKHTL